MTRLKPFNQWPFAGPSGKTQLKPFNQRSFSGPPVRTPDSKQMSCSGLPDEKLSEIQTS
jgi:hypothetical protein